jgi:excisionase family DNA binding protein
MRMNHTTPLEGHEMPTVAIGEPRQEILSLPAAAKRLPICEAKLRAMVRNGEVPSTKVGRRYYLLVSDIKAHPALGLLWS